MAVMDEPQQVQEIDLANEIDEFHEGSGDETLNNEIDTPDVADSSLDGIRHLAVDPATGQKAMPDAKPPIRVAKPAAKAQDDEAEAEPEKEIVKPWARARVLEREKRAAQEQVGTLERRVEKLATALEGLMARGVSPQTEATEAEDKAIDPEVDPAGAIMQQLNAVKSEIREDKAMREARAQADVIVEALTTVNHSLQKQLSEDPVFQGGLEHVAKVMERSMAKKFPDLNERDRLHLVADSTNKAKLEWARDGKDPVEEMYDLAMTLGFDPDAYEAALSTKGAHTGTKSAQEAPGSTKSGKAAEDPRKSVERARSRQASVAGLGNVEGARPQKNAAKALAAAKTEEEFDTELDRLLDSGEMQRDRSSLAGTPSFSQLLPGKGVRIR